MELPPYRRLAFEGPAGTGKTHELLAALVGLLDQLPLLPHQRVLALTYMHGSRRRLDARLALLPLLKKRYLVQTIDAFAAALVHRRRSLARTLGLAPSTFDDTCAAAARIAGHPSVAAWVAASFPIILVDEFQDVDVPRLNLIQAFSNAAHILVGADEFQCLNPFLLPSAAVQWMHEVFQVTPLQQPRRTADHGLLRAAHAIRAGASPAIGGGFAIVVPPGPGASAYCIAQAIAKHPRGTIAIISPSLAGPMPEILSRLRNADGKINQFGKFHIRQESTSQESVASLMTSCQLTDRRDLQRCIAELAATADPQLCRLSDWLRRKQSVSPISELTNDMIKDRLELILHQTRSFGASQERGILAATVHGAKNREFDGVVVFWPFAIPKDPEQRRRLLYNAVTRAKSWCTVVLFSKKLMGEVPFA